MRAFLKYSIASSLILCGFQSNAFAECIAKSGANTTPLLELYTSEGCSSCPPADKWLSTLRDKNLKVTPLAFHVDYWNYIGWKDRFSKAQYSERQREGAGLNGSGYVYTPQFMMNGKDFRGVSSHKFTDTLARYAQSPAPATLTLEAVQQADGKLVLTANATTLKPEYAKHTQAFVALYQNALSSRVDAGENSGRELKHDYVVRELWGGFPLNQPLRKDFILSAEWSGLDAGAVVFVQNMQSGEVLHSLQLPFCKS